MPSVQNPETIIACVGPSPLSSEVVRRAKRLADQFDARWRAVYVEKPRSHAQGSPGKEHAMEHLSLALELGAEVEVLQDLSISAGLSRAVNREEEPLLVIGKPGYHRWRDRIFGSVVERILRQTDDVEIHLVPGDSSEIDRSNVGRFWLSRDELKVGQSIAALLVVALCTTVGLGIRSWVADADIVMVFLLGVMFAAYRMDRLPAIGAALASVAAFDFFFVTPYYTFAVHQGKYLLTFAVMAVVGVAISGLTARVKGQAAAARRREENTAALYNFVQKLALEKDSKELLQTAAQHLHELFGVDVVIARTETTRADDETTIHAGAQPGPFIDDGDLPRSDTALPEHSAESSSENAPRGADLVVPISGVNEQFGMVAIDSTESSQFSDPSQRNLLEAHVDQIGLFLERLNLSEQARRTHIELETERVRNAILSSVSHDLRTPLGSVMGAASTLAESGENLSEDGRTQLARAIYEESRRLDRLLENLLKMTRIEGAELSVNAEWQIPSEIVGTALSHLEPELADREITTRLPDSGRVAQFDGPLIEQVLVNLLENAIQYAPEGSPIHVDVELSDSELTFSIEDAGPGLEAGEEERIFEKFERGSSAERAAGSGLGLTICRAIVEAHGGTIRAKNAPDGEGAVFTFDLPQPDTRPSEPPQIDSDAEDSHQ